MKRTHPEGDQRPELNVKKRLLEESITPTDMTQDVYRLFEDFRSSYDANAPIEQTQQKLNTLKLATARFEDASNAEEQTKQWLLTRETLEYAALFSIRAKDVSAFERYFSQLKTYYFDLSSKLPASQKQYTIIGLELLHSLSKDRLDEFHTLLELIPFEQHSNVFIRHPIQLEQYMMEGAFNKVLAAKNEVPAEQYAYFMDQLMGTVRNGIADCCTSAYDHLSIPEAQRILGLSSQDQLTSFANERKWRVGVLNGENVILFRQEEQGGKVDSQIPSQKLIKQTLQYARELERIV